MRACRLHRANGVQAEMTTAVRFLIGDTGSNAALGGDLGLERPSDGRRAFEVQMRRSSAVIISF